MMTKISASIILPSQQNSILHGTEFTLDAIPDPAMLNFPSGKPTWSDGGLANYLSATGSASITISDEAPSGEYIISATCNNTKTIKVVIADVFIESISGGDKTSTKADSEELGDGETTYILQGTELTLDTAPNPSTEEFPDDKPTWDCEDLSGYFDATSGASITISDEAPSGEYIISATCGNTKVMKVVITNVLLESIGGDGKTSTKENAEEIGENETIYLAQGAQLTLTAAPNPSTAEFPDDKPTWTADELFYYFDTATGESITVNDQAPAGEYIISATCGNTKVIKLVICELLSETQATIPTNRERIKIGVGEEVNLTIQPADIPTVVWTTTDGSFGDNDEYNASRQFIAPDRAANVTVTATFGGTSLTKTFNVVEPDEVTIEQSPGTNIWHINGIASVGFKGDVYILPADVSFHNIEIQEGEVDGVGTGYFAPDDGQVHTLGRWIAVGNVVADKGSKVAGIDTIRSRTSRTPYIDGTFIWSIPFSFRINNGNAKQFTTVNHMETIDTTGKMTISKGGTTKSANLDDPTSDF